MSRMVIRVELGKGGNDRYVTLSTKRLDILRSHRRATRPKEWPFPGGLTGQPITRSVVEDACQKAHHLSALSKNPLHRIHCATTLLSICSNPSPMCGPFSCCLVIEA